MTTRQLTPIATLNQQLAPTFRAAAPDGLVWAQEKTFFEAQVRKHWQIADAVSKGVDQTLESLKLAVRECASMGLSMSPVSQLVYLIPRRERKKWDNESEADYQRKVPWVVHTHPSYRGLAYIATHYAGAAVVAGEVVFKGDTFRYYGPIAKPDHEPTLDNAQRTESKALGAYAVVIMASGIVRAEYVDQPTIAKIRALSDFPSALMWTKLWTEGWKKAAIRRICKTIMVSEPRMEAAVQVLDRHEGITFEGESVPRGTSSGSGPAPEFENAPEPPPPDRGMAGLDSKLKNARARQARTEPEELDPTAPEPRPPNPAENGQADDPGVIEGELDELYGLPRPAPSKNPPGSIEWFADQITDADNLDRLDAVKVAALAARVDASDDADTFRDLYARRSRALKAGDGAAR